MASKIDFITVIIQKDKRTALYEGSKTKVKEFYPIKDVVIGYPGNIQLLADIENGAHEIMDKHVGQKFKAVILPGEFKVRLYPKSK